MPAAPGVLPSPPVSGPAPLAGSGYLRLASCPRCAGRRRALAEVGDELRGRCLSCGEELVLPLQVERAMRLTVVGRAGQRILAAPDD